MAMNNLWSDAEWDETKHPRAPAGSAHGGQFAPKPRPPAPDARYMPDQRAGMVVYRFNRGQLEFLLLRSLTPGFDEGFDLPKGQIEPNEAIYDTALREAREETGIQITERGELGKFPFAVRYGYPKDRTAHLWLGELASDNVDANGNVVSSGDLQRDRENDEVRFYPAAMAMRMVAPDRRPMLQEAMRMLNVPEPRWAAPSGDTRLDDYTAYFDVDDDTIKMRPQVVNRAQGKLGEILVYDNLTRAGYKVSRPAAANDFSPLDIIAERDGKTWLVEVKTADVNKSDKRWRTNIGGAQWKKILAQAGDLSPDERAGLFRKMTEHVIAQKQKVLQALRARGVDAHPLTIGVTVDYTQRNAAFYYFGEWFPSRNWSNLRPDKHVAVSAKDLMDATLESGSVGINARTGGFNEYPSVITRKFSPDADALWAEYERYAEQGLSDCLDIALMGTASSDAVDGPNPEFDLTDPLYDDAVDDDETGMLGMDGVRRASKAVNRRGVDVLGAELESVVARYQAGMLIRGAARQEFLDTLRARYLKAFSKVARAERYDRANALVVQQAMYLDKFLDAVDAGMEQDKAFRRARLYAESLRAARAQAQILKMPKRQKLQWVVNPTAEHCTDCAGLNGKIKSAQQWRALNLFPGCAQNECGQFCKCKMRAVGFVIPRKNSPEGKKIRQYLGI